MDMTPETNSVILCGALAGRPVFSHENRGQAFYRFPLEVRRLSGNLDLLPILLRREQLEALEVREADRLRVVGQLRSFNNRSGSGARLVLSVLARELAYAGEPDDNRVRLRGSLCKAPVLRRTPMGREICDLMLAVNRRCGRSDYLPCICWGRLAREAAGWAVGDRLSLSGRFQSRAYSKLTEEGPVSRTAYEVSAAELERLTPD